MVRERLRHGSPGLLLLPLLLVLFVVPIRVWVAGVRAIQSGDSSGQWYLITAVLMVIAWVLTLRGFFIVGQQRLSKAGVEVLEARISHLAYAPEIAAAMLQRQQAGAIIAARQRIVEGAVGMVEMALQALPQKEIVRLDEERTAAMVSNLLVVLRGEPSPQPIVNTGTIHQ